MAADDRPVVRRQSRGAWLRRARAWLLVCGVVGLAVSASTALPGGVDAADVVADRAPARRRLPGAAEVERTLARRGGDVLGRRVRRGRRRPHRAWAGPAVAYALVLCALFPAGVARSAPPPQSLSPRYPPYWYRTAEFLCRAVPADEPILVLPWHLYQPLVASKGRAVANPAPVFFPGRLVVPQNLEIPGRFSEVSSRYDRIGAVIRREGYRSCAVARAIRREDVRWVLVLDGTEGRGAVVGLRRCGFELVQGRPGRTSVLRL